VRDKLKNLLIAKKVLVNLINGKAFRGVLYDSQKAFILLKDAEIIEPGNNPVKATGSIIILKEKIDFIQVLEN